jgi:DNA invertase Pin-like site-specific DNA recombinase
MRSLKHLLPLVDELRQRAVRLVVLRQQIDTTTPTGRLMFHILGAIDEFQRQLIVEGTREGLDAARARGRTWTRKLKLNARQAATVRRMYRATRPDGKRQHTVAEIAEAVGVHRTTVYDYPNGKPSSPAVRLAMAPSKSPALPATPPAPGSSAARSTSEAQAAGHCRPHCPGRTRRP